MQTSLLWPRTLIVIGLLVMLLGAIDPLEGSLIMLPGSGMIVFGSFLGRSRRRRVLLWALILVAVGVGTLWAMSALGGIGGDTGRSIWWALVLLPYPLGWAVSVTGAILVLIEFSRKLPGST